MTGGYASVDHQPWPDRDYRLVYVTASYPYDGDVEDFFAPEVASLLRQGCDVLLVPRHPRGMVLPREERLRRERCLPAPLLSFGILLRAVRTARRPRVLLRISKLLFRSRNAGTLLRNLAVVPKGLWLGDVAHRWGADHIHAHWAGANATLAMVASLASGIPWSFSAHRGDIVQRNLLPEKCRSAAMVRFIAADGVRLARECGAVGLETKARVVRLGVDVPSGHAGRLNRSGPLTVLCPARLLPVKGHVFLIDALHILVAEGGHYVLLLAGDGPLRAELQTRVERLGLGNHVRFLGFVPQRDLLRTYTNGEVDVVVLGSVDLGGGLHEGVPVSLVEAMAHGIPTVSTETGGIRELLRDGCGVLVPPANPAALAEAIARLGNEHDLRESVIRAARQRVLEEYSAEVTARLLLSAIRDSADLDARLHA